MSQLFASGAQSIGWVYCFQCLCLDLVDKCLNFLGPVLLNFNLMPTVSGEHPDVETREGTERVMGMRVSPEMLTNPFLIRPPPGGEQGWKSLIPQGSGPRSPFGHGTTLSSHYDGVLGISSCPYTSNIY